MKNQLLLGAIATSVLAATAAVVAPSANALALVNGTTTCSTSDFSGSSACEGAFASNQPKQDITTTETFFGMDGWEFLMKDDGSLDGVRAVDLESGAFGQTASIDWSFAAGFDTSAYSKIFFTVKGGPNFSAYLWDGTSQSGTFSTAGILTGGNKPKPSPGLSNFGVFGISCTPDSCDDPTDPPTEVPTPAAVLPILGGLFGAASRRKKGESTEA